ncbi:MAG: catM 2 [Firmicutes bacterium]|nr:catM 2 [Bacillota bacterium]
MDIRQLKYFLAVAEEGQITKAAKRLHITQPPLSQQMQLLEKELGTQLIERGNRDIRLTEAGHALRNRAEQMVNLMELTIGELQQITDGTHGVLTIGTIPSVNALLFEHIHQFSKQHPHVTFQLWHRETYSILDLVNTGAVDLGIVRLPIDLSIYDFILLPEQRMGAIGKSVWFDDKTSQTINLHELKGKPLMLHKRDTPVILDHCHQTGFDPQVFCTSDDIMPLLYWARSGIAIALIPDSAQNLLSSSSLIFKEISSPVIKINSALLWRKNRPLSSVAINFISMFK